MTANDRAELARIHVMLSTGAPAVEAVLTACIRLERLIGLPGSEQYRDAFRAAHAMPSASSASFTPSPD